MSVLDHAARMRIDAYDPAVVIDAVRSLQGLDRSEALDRIATASTSARAGRSEGTGLFWALRVLFDLPDDTPYPPVLLGRPSLPPPSDAATIPRFPILLVDDVPLLIVRGYDLAGVPQAVDDHVAFFRDHGVVRASPLSPPPDLATIEPQAVTLLRSAYPPGTTGDAEVFISEQLHRGAPG